VTNRKIYSRAVAGLAATVLAGMGALSGGVAQAAVPGITGNPGLAAAPGAATMFNLTARAGSISQPDGGVLYSWGYGCTLTTTTGTAPAGFSSIASCPEFQVPAPTLIVREGTVVTVKLTNNLPAPAGNTSIVFPGFQTSAQVTTVGPVNLSANVPTVANPTISASSNTTYANSGVVWGVGALLSGSLTQVTTTPVAGQYSVLGGNYTFSIADAGQPVIISGTTSSGVPTAVPPLSVTLNTPAPVTAVVASSDPTYADTGVVWGSGASATGNLAMVTTTPLTSGQYSVVGATYTFSDADAGQPVVINGTTTTAPVNLSAGIPAVAAPTLVASTAAGYISTSVVWGVGALLSGSLTQVTTTPAAGQYSVLGGNYTFSIADAGQPVTITGTTPSTTTTGANGIMTQEAAPGGTVTYTFTANKAGTYAYYSGTQPELQIEMGLYGALIVLPNLAMDAACAPSIRTGADQTYRLANAAYDHPQTCYDREYLFQFAEADSRIHRAAEEQVQACAAGKCAPAVVVATDPYVPNYFLVNGRSMPDLMDGSFIPNFPSQPYNGNPHIRPGEMLLLRTIGQGRIQHPFHIHGDHARTLARDGNLLVAQVDPSPATNPAGVTPAKVNRLAGPLIFTVPTVSGQTLDGLFSWSGKGLNWDVYGPTNHTCNEASFPGYGTVPALPTPVAMDDPGYGAYLTNVATITATTVSAGYDAASGENCADHGKPIPVMPPDPQIVANGLWYSGTPYLGVQTIGSAFASTPLPPGIALQNTSAGYAYMWHSHDEREITTNDVFPGGMMMMLIIDPPTAPVDETK
jgi:FtsP/CotA-like multicopper oxidase with cupredoxin domain